MKKEEKDEIEKVHALLKKKPILGSKLLCKLFGHKWRKVGTFGYGGETYCKWCGKVLAKF